MSDWLDEALCAQVGGEWWFPEKGEQAHVAKRICGQCPVRHDCLMDSLERGDVHEGILGGLSPRERQALMPARVPVPVDERVEHVRARTDAGWSADQIAAELGVHERTVWRLRVKGRAA